MSAGGRRGKAAAPRGGAGGPADREARVAAVTDFERNLVVTAGAGTGKTALLVERALNLVAGCGLPIASLAAITFTEKAAAELRERLAAGLDALHRLAASGAAAGAADPLTEAGRSYAWLRGAGGVEAETIASRALAALLDLDVASVGTIHAFCADILRRHPLEAGVDPGFDIDEGGSFDTLFEAAAARFLAAELGPRAGRAALWRRVLSIPGGTEAVREIGALMASFRLPDPPGEAGGPQAAASPGALPDADLADADLRDPGDAIDRVLGRGLPMNPGMAAHLEAARRFLAAVRDQGPAALAAERAPLLEYLAKSPAPGARLPAADAAAVGDLALRARQILRALAAVDEAAIGTLVEAATPLARAARADLLHAGWVSFDGLLRIARDLLAARPEARRELGRRYGAILLDEFQDTDPLQYEILFFIAEEEGPPAADAWRARLTPGRLFIVGDPKQSIYRFRGADIEAYLRAVRRILETGGRELTLTSSFRSPADIVEPINRLFAPWMVPERDGGEAFQPRYDRLDSARGPAQGLTPRVEIWSVEADGGADERRGAEADAIAAWIAGRLGRDDATGRPLRYGDVAILLRALTHAGLYAQALRRAGIPFLVDGGKAFYERPEVGDLIAFLRAVANPNDGPAVLAVMRSILGGVPDADLARFALDGGRFDVPGGGAVDRAAHPAVARAFSLIDGFRARLRGRAADWQVRAAVRDTPLLLLHASAFEGAQRAANLAKLVAEAEDLARRGLSLEEVIGALEDERRGGRDGGESPLADDTIDAVRVLSIHKAKGLQYPVVFVPDLGRQERRPAGPRHEVAWLAGENGGRLAIRIDGGITNLAWVRHAERARRHEAAEEKRVFYVACTRARERLVLVNSSPKRGSAPWRDALAALGYGVGDGFPEDGALAPGVGHRRVGARPARPASRPAAVDAAWSEAAGAFAAVSAAALAGAVPPLRWPSGTRDGQVAGAGDPGGPEGAPAPPPGGAAGEAAARGAAPDRAAARLAGTAVHAALEGWDFKDAGALREAALRETERLARRDPAARLPAEAARNEVAAILEGFLRSDLPARLAGLEILGREVPVLYADPDGTTWVGACDLIYRDASGAVVVADYKTDRVEGDAAEAAAPYRDQLRVYREAVTRAFAGTPVRTEILFLRAGVVVPIHSGAESVDRAEGAASPPWGVRGSDGP